MVRVERLCGKRGSIEAGAGSFNVDNAEGAYNCDFLSAHLLCVGGFGTLDSMDESWTGAWAARVTEDGSLDPTFGSGGVLTRFLAPDTDTSNIVGAGLEADQFILAE